MHPYRIIFRADGNSNIGLGHIYRCLALIEMLKNDFKCIFILKIQDKELISIIQNYCEFIVLGTHESIDELYYLKKHLTSKDILVLDGYHFGSNYQKQIKESVKKLVMIDDIAHSYYWADLIINHGNPETMEKYKTSPLTKILIGPKYLILRTIFRHYATLPYKPIVQVNTVFICLGGADPFNITNKILDAIIPLSFVKKIIIVIGGMYRFQTELFSRISQCNDNKEVVLEKNISAERIVELISASQIAITPASSIALEAVCIKTGLLSGFVIDNQGPIHDLLLKLNCIISIGDFITADIQDIRKTVEEMNNANLLNCLISNQELNFDGLSGERILNEFKLLVA